MLVLTRKQKESIIIAANEHAGIKEPIQICVLGIRGSSIQLGIQADDSIDIYREEIYQRLLNQQQHYTA